MITANGLDHFFDLELGQKDHGGSRQDGEVHASRHAIRVEERRDTQGDLLSITRLDIPRARLEGVCQQIAMREHGPFGNTCGSTGVLKRCEIVAGEMRR